MSVRIAGTMILGLLMSGLPCRMVRRFLPRRGAKLWELGPHALFFVLFNLLTWVADENALILLPFFFLTFLACYGGPVLARLAMASILYTVFISISMMIDSARPLWTLYPESLHIVGVGLKMLCWAVLWWLVRYALPAEKPLRLSNRMWLLVGALSLAPLFAQLGFVLFNLHGIRDEVVYAAVAGYLFQMAYLVLPFALLSSLVLLFALPRLASYEQLARERQLEQMNQAYYQQLEQQYAQIRRLRHDMANHLQTLAALPAQEHSAYLGQLVDSPALRAPRKWSENRVVNAVLAAKAEQMEAENIRADLSAPLPRLLPYSDVDLCALFANSLDNAIEACRGLPQEERRITLKARMDKGLFALQVRNPCSSEPPRERGRFRTTKADPRHHGLGLVGMESIAEKYGGDFSAEFRDGEFELLLCLPLAG